MKTFLLLALVFALVLAPMVMAAPGITGRQIDCNYYPNDPECTVPEFTTIGVGIAIIGAGIGYSLIRKKK